MLGDWIAWYSLGSCAIVLMVVVRTAIDSKDLLPILVWLAVFGIPYARAIGAL